MTDISEDGLQRIRMQLQEMQKEYIASLPARLDEISTLWHAYSSSRDPDTGRALVTATHKVAGTSTLYGLTELGALARSLEEQLADELDGIDDITDQDSFARQMNELIASKAG